MNRNRTIIGLVAVLAILVGGTYVASNVFACGNCPAHAQKANATDANAADAKATEATATKTGGSCCASGAMKADAKTASAKGACMDGAKEASVQTASAKGTCAAGAKADAKGQCSYHNMKTAELMDGETTLATLAHCGIDVNATSTETLAAKLAAGHCGMYSVKQWASMIDAAKGLDAKTTKTVLTSAKSEKMCAGKECPISLVAKELAQKDTEAN